ncbi:hypothetical protein [Anaerocolumna chitinilytica]|uniref:Uncharacterized protein n=1 Tax=Anaerocolumna chitinilytica TaxID=1727145 RepID=A0A7M3SAW4_9FIRM|nr:hypothetical protein [Anaerocolumna chitinilytica]BCK01732.1 hypothetical protein bsdcttw_47720 [Anaerocolumna chitinilytica]
MKWNISRKMIILISLITILTGFVISVAGYGVEGFNYSHFKEKANSSAWYQTIHANDDNLWYGIKLGDDINLFVIGSSD